MTGNAVARPVRACAGDCAFTPDRTPPRAGLRASSWLLALIAACVARPSDASGCLGDDASGGPGSYFLVKHVHALQIAAADGDCAPHPSLSIAAFDWVPETFVPAAAVVAAGVEAGHTVDPIHETGFSTIGGVVFGEYTLLAHSLHDIGVYGYRVIGEACNVDKSHCEPLQDDVLNFTVGNAPPTPSIAFGGDPHVGGTLTFHAIASDADHGDFGLQFGWAVVQRPPSSLSMIANFGTTDTTLLLGGKHDIGTWTVRLVVDDLEGERKTVDRTFAVENRAPTVSIDGPALIEALEDIALHAEPAMDEDGEDLTFTWDVLEAPFGAEVKEQPGFAGGDTLTIPTGPQDIGTWRFRCTATDEHDTSASAEHKIMVLPVEPQIALQGATEIDIGAMLHQETTVLDDAYGKPLLFEWVLFQVPVTAGKVVPSVVATTAAVDIATGAADAGTWGLRLTVTDHLGHTATQAVSVLVDGLPQATIDGPDVGGNLSAPLTLDGSASLDPDSPTAETDLGHLTSEPPVQVSPGLVEHTWRVLQVPPAFYGDFFPGTVADVFGIAGNGAVLDLPAGTLPAGAWLFELEVHDGEGNVEYANHAVNMIDEGTSPIATIAGPVYHLVDAVGNAPVAIVVDGSQSFDLDNLLDSPPAPGLGIVDYAWRYVSSPPTCDAVPALGGGAAPTATLFAAGSIVVGGCQGAYAIGLTVTDDDVPEAAMGFGSQMLFIGNCPQDICIDYPLQAQPQYVKFSDQTDVVVYYHLNSLLYDQPAFALGMRLQLRVFHESDALQPVYDRAFDLDMLPTDKGGYLAVHWAGFDTFDLRPVSGRYSIELALLDATGMPTGTAAREDNAIHIRTLEVTLGSATTRYAQRTALQDGSETIKLAYDVPLADSAEALPFDEVRWRVYEAGTDTVVHAAVVSQPSSAQGEVSWNGDLGGGNFIGTGAYDIELAIADDGAVLGTSARAPLNVYAFQYQVGGAAAPAALPGVRVYANLDDDDRNAVRDDLEVAAGEDDLVKIDLALSGLDHGDAKITVTPAATLRLFAAGNKSGEIALPAGFDIAAVPLPASVFVEGLATALPSLAVNFNMPDGHELGPFTLPLTIAELAVRIDNDDDHAITSADVTPFAVSIGRWNQSYGANNVPHNNAGNLHLVEQDAERFHVRLRDRSANTDPGVVDAVTLKIGTVDKNGAIDDDLTDIVLTETGADSGEFLSRSQLLMTSDTPTNADDDFAAHDGTAGNVNDDVAGDRTHRATIDGDVRIVYQPAGVAGAKPWSVPVCLRAPDERRRAELRVVIFNEPYSDTGYDHDSNAATPSVGAGNTAFDFTDANANGTHDAGEASEMFIDISAGGVTYAHAGARAGVVSQANVDAELQRANLSWAQACIRIVNLGTTFADAPKLAGVDILADAITTLGNGGDEPAVVAAYAPTAKIDEILVFFTAPFPSYWAVSRTPSDKIAGQGEATFVYMGSSAAPPMRTLAHEMGHALTNGNDTVQPKWMIYPQLTGGTWNDGTVDERRRLLDFMIIEARTVRDAGDVMAVGNRILKIP